MLSTAQATAGGSATVGLMFELAALGILDQASFDRIEKFVQQSIQLSGASEDATAALSQMWSERLRQVRNTARP